MLLLLFYASFTTLCFVHNDSVLLLLFYASFLSLSNAHTLVQHPGENFVTVLADFLV